MSGEPSDTASLLALVGPTASGKTRVAMDLALNFERLELVSIDSMTVYRSMDIGTAKPTQEDIKGISYHLLDVVDPWEEYSVSQFQLDASAVLDAIAKRQGLPLLVGGTGLYFQAVVDSLEIPGRWPDIRSDLESRADTESGILELYGQLQKLDPAAALKMEPNNSRRIIRALEVTLGSGRRFSDQGPGLFKAGAGGVQAVGIDLPRAELFDRIEKRLDQLLASGWIEEVQVLLRSPRALSRTARQALGYKEIISFLEGNLTLPEARLAILARTKRLAKRQAAWFRRDPRITWFSTPERAKMELVSIVSGILSCPRGSD